MSKNDLFLRVMTGIFILVLLYGVAMTVVAFWGDPQLARIMLSAFATMFTAIVGFGTGYLIGRNGS